MKPFKAGVPFAKWLLRVALLAYLVMTYYSTVETLNFESLRFWTAFLFILFAVLLFIGGFLSKSSLTVISGLIIFVLALYKMIVSFDGQIDSDFVHFLLPMSIGFYFFARGNLG